MLKSEFQNATWWMVESSAVCKGKWKADFHNTTKSPTGICSILRCVGESVGIRIAEHYKIRREFIEISAVWENYLEIIIPQSPRQPGSKVAPWSGQQGRGEPKRAILWCG